MALKRVALSGAMLAVDDRGDGAPAILFIHGFPFDHALWRHQLGMFSGWRRIAPDLRGAGVSSVPGAPDGYSIARYANDLIQLLDASGIAHAVVCGLSMGGYILFELLRRHPARVRAAVLCNTKAAADSAEARRDRDAMAALARNEGTDAVADKLLPRVLARATLDQKSQVVNEVKRMIICQPVAGVVGALRALRDRVDSTPLLPTIRVPVLVVAGDDDQIAPANGMEEMAGTIHGARFVLIKDAGHVTPLEQPLALNTALEDFLADLGYAPLR
jgi:3-oxoadipate enol-lactonase